MINKEILFQALENNKKVILHARQVLDTVTAVSLAGAAQDKQCRDMIISGGMTTISSTIIHTGMCALNITGPIVFGVALIPVMSKISIGIGIGTILGGFIRGFRVGMKKLV